MNKKEFIISTSLKILIVLILIFLTAFVISAASSRSLPFLPEKPQEYSIYHESSKTPDSSDISSRPDLSNDSSQEESSEIMSFDGYLHNIEVHNDLHSVLKISCDIYSRHFLTRRNITNFIGDTVNFNLEVRMGFIFIKNGSENIKILNSRLEDVTERLNEYEFTGERDYSGNPLFIKNSAYYYIDDNGDIQKSNFDTRLHTRGLTFDYPRYFGVQHEFIKKTRNGNLYGYRSSTRSYVYENNKESFAYSDRGVGIVIPNSTQNNLHFYDTVYNLISEKYYASENRTIDAIGYYYFDNLMTRVRVKNSDGTFSEALSYDDGTLVTGIPVDYKLRGYSDGCILLEKDGYFGYMNTAFNWITTPSFIEARPFLEGFAVVCTQKGKYGVIDTNGNYTVAPVFDAITNCSDGIFIGYEKDNGYILFTKYEK